MPLFLARRALIMIALSTVVTLGVTCNQVCAEAHTNLTLTCSGGYKSDFKHVYWKAGSANKSIASCYNRNTECYIHDGLRYWADRADLNDTVFESSLLVENIGHNIVIKCFLWVAGWKKETLINTTRILVDGDCGQLGIEGFFDTGTPVNATTDTPVNTTTHTPVNAMTDTPVNDISVPRVNKLRIISGGFTEFIVFMSTHPCVTLLLILFACLCASTVAIDRKRTSSIPFSLGPKDNPLKTYPAVKTILRRARKNTALVARRV